ncbi:MAG: flagellar protein FhlB [Alphaproteobacteria bacterium]|nr:flagellar protein FhlB [Alphaproteobacteria bacterium]
MAIALEEQIDTAPKVVATGRGLMAEKILELAFANDVRVREDSDLVQILAAVDIDSPIPTDAFTAVAEVLTYLYKANGSAAPEGLGAWHE